MLTASLIILTILGQICAGEPLPVPTRAEVVAFDLDAYADASETHCLPFSLAAGERCKETRLPIAIKGKDLTALAALLRNQASYDPGRAARCHEPRHRVRFYYGDSPIDSYDVCFACENVSLSGTSPFVGCSPAGASAAMPPQLTFTPEALSRLRQLLTRAHVALVPKPSHRDWLDRLS
jgi:hypothetical protein